jgi:hypothetical protein
MASMGKLAPKHRSGCTRVVALALLLLGLLASAAPSQAATDTPAPAAVEAPASPAAPPPAPSARQSEIALLGWFTGVDSVVTVGGLQIPVHEGFSDVIDNVDVGFMGSYETRRDRTGYYVNLVHARITDQILVLDFINVDYRATQTYLEAGTLLRLDRGKNPLELMAGLRYSALDADYTPTPGAPGSKQESWTNPVVGLRYQVPLSDKWRFSARGDIGALGSDSSRQAVLHFRYQLRERTALDLGYHYFHTQHENGDFEYEVTLKGPFVGVAYQF